MVAIGNAPTALFHLLDLLDAGAPHPAAIIGLPVGFVGAAESKDALWAGRPVPCLVLPGRRGGSAMAVAAVNALAQRRRMTGTLYSVGVGPGDPELLTLKAARILAAAPAHAYFAKRGRPSHAARIAAAHLRPDAEALRFDYPFTTEMPVTDPRYAAGMAAFYEAAAATIAARLDAGRSVALLCEGDPFFYGSAMYVFDRLRPATARGRARRHRHVRRVGPGGHAHDPWRRRADRPAGHAAADRPGRRCCGDRRRRRS